MRQLNGSHHQKAGLAEGAKAKSAAADNTT